MSTVLEILYQRDKNNIVSSVKESFQTGIDCYELTNEQIIEIATECIKGITTLAFNEIKRRTK